jgi:hypothetical protein
MKAETYVGLGFFKTINVLIGSACVGIVFTSIVIYISVLPLLNRVLRAIVRNVDSSVVQVVTCAEVVFLAIKSIYSY